VQAAVPSDRQGHWRTREAVAVVDPSCPAHCECGSWTHPGRCRNVSREGVTGMAPGLSVPLARVGPLLWCARSRLVSHVCRLPVRS
jgi:hypothetical protein